MASDRYRCVAIALVGIVVLLGYGMAHSSPKEEIRSCEETLPGHDIFSRKTFASREVNRSISIARQKTSTRISPR